MKSNEYLCSQYNQTAVNKINDLGILYICVCVPMSVYTQSVYFIYIKNHYAEVQACVWKSKCSNPFHAKTQCISHEM